MMIHSFDQNTLACDSVGCLSAADIDALLGESLNEEHQEALIAHLDECPTCRSRLEAAADSAGLLNLADEQRWNEAGGSLASKRLEETLSSLRDGTRQFSPLPSIEAAATSELNTLQRLGRYEIGEVLGRGGMGIVYLATDTMLQRKVAIKLIREPWARDAKARLRIQREARVVAAIRNPHVVSIHHIEQTPSGAPYLVMEYVAGISLEQRLQEEPPLTWQEIARIGSQVARGLAAAHEKGLVHRDVKPGNILLEKETGTAKLTDLGLARSLEENANPANDCVSGTPEYIAPEQAAGMNADHRADLFSLGSVLYRLCTGRPPFRAENPLVVLKQTQERTPVPVGRLNSEIPEALCKVVEKLMRKNPAKRFGSAKEVAEVLQRISNGESVSLPMGSLVAEGTPRRAPRFAQFSLIGGLLLAAGFGLSEAAGLTQLLEGELAPQAATGVENPENAEEDRDEATASEEPASPQPTDEAGLVAAETDKNQSEEKADDKPPRVQIVTPDGLMRERILEEKDTLEREPSPFLVRKFEGHTGPVSDFAFTPDGEYIVSCSGWPTGDRTVRLWNVDNGEQVRLFDTSDVPKDPALSGGREAPGEFQDVAISPDGRHAVTASTGGAVCVWEIETGSVVRQFLEHTGTPYAVDISPDGQKVLSAGRDQVARLWDISTGEELLRIPGHTSWIRTVAFSPDGNRALTGGLGEVLRLWDLEQAKELQEMKAGDGWVWQARFSPDGERAASASGTVIHLWDLSTGQEIRQFRGHGADVTAVAFSPDGRYLLSGSYDRTVRVWNTDTGEELRMYLGHRDWIWQVAFTPDGKYAASAGGGRRTQVGGTEPGVDFGIRHICTREFFSGGLLIYKRSIFRGRSMSRSATGRDLTK